MDTRTFRILSVCAGIGGQDLGLHAALAGRSRTVCYVENELGAASSLETSFQNGTLDPAPIWTDLRTFDPEPWRGKVDILAGGFPCQPHSVAGSQLGEDDPRELSGEVLRIAAGLGHPTLFLENVPGILRFYWDSIRPKLREMGYEVAEGLFTASETGAPHRRERLFILAHAASVDDTKGTRWGVHNAEDTGTIYGDVYTSPDASNHELAHAAGPGCREAMGHANAGLGDHEAEQVRAGRDTSSYAGGGHALAHADGEGLQRRDECGDSARERAARPSSPELGELPLYPPGPGDHAGWEWLLARWPELGPTVCKEAPVQSQMPQAECEFCGSSARTTQELPNDVLLRALGNAVVPAVAKRAFETLSRQLGWGGG